MRSLAWIVLLMMVVAMGSVAACSANGEGGQGAAAAAPGAGGSGGGLFSTGGGINQSLELVPPEATIEVVNGISTPVQFTALKDGQQVYPNSWKVDYGTIASVDNQGLVSASNNKGGGVILTAELDGIIGSAKVFVIYKKVINDDGLPQDEIDKLDNPVGDDAAITWAYPYDKTVWPQGLKGPELMWNGGGVGDSYLSHFVGQFVDIKVYMKADPPSRFQMQPAEWVAINESGGGQTGNVSLEVARLAVGAPTAATVVEHDWTMSRGSLKGTVYYWANNLGRIVRIKPGQDLPEDFLAAAGVTQCTACHTVSADGHTLVIGGDAATSTYDLLTDTTTLSLLSVGKPVRNWAMPAVSPDGRFVVENNANLPGPPGGSDGLWDSATGMKLAGSGLDGVLLDMPAFGPKGHKLAYVDHGNTHDLRVYDFDLLAGAASNEQPLVAAGGDPALNAICFPNVSPTIVKGEGAGATYVVYHRGVFPVPGSSTDSLDTRFGPGDLYMASADTPNIEWRLGKTNGDAYPFAAGARDLSYNYEPTFAPQAAGGYMWVVFTSRRTYGNRLTGGKDAVKQLWVAAIDPFPEPGTDPSHAAFWVPGQDPNTLNMRGYWALDPCIQQGDTCSVDADCCDGSLCENGLCGGENTCAQIGDFCDGNADCCDPTAECIAQECIHPGPN